jgi:hypothetical protein
VTRRWLRISTIAVEHTQKEVFPYVLSNRTEREKARANYLGSDASRISDIPEVA